MRRDYDQRCDDIYRRAIRRARVAQAYPLGKHGRKCTARERHRNRQLQIQLHRRQAAQPDFDVDYDPEDTDESCWRCGGEGWGIVGTDWDADDPINGPYDGDVERCECCGGTGRAEDCVSW